MTMNRNTISPFSSFLFSTPSFLEGMSRCLDIFGVYDRYNLSETPHEADAIAIRNDWAAVCMHLNDAFIHEQAKIEAQAKAR
jgi:hypothetical protein